MGTPVVFFDMTIGGAPAGRIEMTLRADVVPKTAEVRLIRRHAAPYACRPRCLRRSLRYALSRALSPLVHPPALAA